MEISNAALMEYKQIYLKQFGVTLADDQAKEQAIELLRVFRIIYRPIPDRNEIKSHETQQA